MSELKCTDCGHSVENHYLDGCNVGWEGSNPPCMCKRNNFHAISSANQRAAAIAHLREITGKRKKFKRPSVGWNRLDNELWSAVAAYRAVGILKAPKP